MFYKITQLSDLLYLIRWDKFAKPNYRPEENIIRDLKKILDTVEAPIYFISDLRRGRITNINRIHKLASLTTHPHFAGSTAFSEDPISSIFVSTFSRFDLRPEAHHELWNTPEEALQYLESLHPGISQAIDWDKVLTPD